MKRRFVLVQCCVVLSVLLTGCQLITNIKKDEKQSERMTETVTEMQADTGSEKLTENIVFTEEVIHEEAAVGLGTVQEVSECNVSTEQAEIIIYEPETEVIQSDPEVAEASYEEEYMQCPYCAHWFSAWEDGNGTPYDRHIAQERATDSAHGLTEAELAECPDCGNWYPTGNIFRNHICEGREF